MRKTKPIRLYQFQELSPGAKARAIDAEREALKPVIHGMIVALFELELAGVGGRLTDLTIDWKEKRVMADGEADAPAGIVSQILAETVETAQEELPYYLSDAYAQANIKAENPEFFANGKARE